MPGIRAYVSHALPARTTSTWATQFADELQRQGIDVAVEWSIRDEVSLATAERHFRQSDVVVALVDHESTESANLYFELGAAMAGDKAFIAIIPSDLDPNRLPAPLRRDGFLVQRSPAETAAAVASRPLERQTA